MRLVFEKLKKAGLSVNVKKTKVGLTSVKYLGLEITPEGLRPDRDKVRVLEEMGPPLDVQETRRFLGLSGYFRSFIPHFSIRAAPLTKLLSKNTDWVWGKQ